MTCGCNKNKGTNPQMNNEPIKEPSAPVEFKERAINKTSAVAKQLGMVKSFASAIASRGLSNTKVSIPLKQLRALSCFGNKAQGGVLPPCEYLRKSTTEGRFFCGGCGCGDKKHTWLSQDDIEYSKLDYPKLACPLQMPGFSNYKESAPEEAISPITRRYYVENVNYDQLKQITVTTHEQPQAPSTSPLPELPK